MVLSRRWKISPAPRPLRSTEQLRKSTLRACFSLSAVYRAEPLMVGSPPIGGRGPNQCLGLSTHRNNPSTGGGSRKHFLPTGRQTWITRSASSTVYSSQVCRRNASDESDSGLLTQSQECVDRGEIGGESRTGNQDRSVRCNRNLTGFVEL